MKTIPNKWLQAKSNQKITFEVGYGQSQIKSFMKVKKNVHTNFATPVEKTNQSTVSSDTDYMN